MKTGAGPLQRRREEEYCYDGGRPSQGGPLWLFRPSGDEMEIETWFSGKKLKSLGQFPKAVTGLI